MSSRKTKTKRKAYKQSISPNCSCPDPNWQKIWKEGYKEKYPDFFDFICSDEDVLLIPHEFLREEDSETPYGKPCKIQIYKCKDCGKDWTPKLGYA